MTNYLIVRHGETEGTLAGIHECRTSTRMTVKGNEEILRLSRKIYQSQQKGTIPIFDNIYHSPMMRCKESLEILIRNVKYKQKAKCKTLLLEHNMGVYDGLTKKEVNKLSPRFNRLRAANRWHVRPPQGENYFDVQKRVIDFILEVEEKNKTVLVIAHKALNKILIGTLKGMARDDFYDINMPTGGAYYLKQEIGTKYRMKKIKV